MTCVWCRLQWVGPKDDETIQQEFEALFNRSTELSGDCFFAAEEELVQQDLAKRFDKRGLVFDASDGQTSKDHLLQALPPGAVQRFEAYEKVARERDSSGNSAFICDVQQWPSNGCSTARQVCLSNDACLADAQQ